VARPRSKERIARGKRCDGASRNIDDEPRSALFKVRERETTSLISRHPEINQSNVSVH